MGRARCRHFRVASTSTCGAVWGTRLERTRGHRPGTHPVLSSKRYFWHHSASQNSFAAGQTAHSSEIKKDRSQEAFVKPLRRNPAPHALGPWRRLQPPRRRRWRVGAPAASPSTPRSTPTTSALSCPSLPLRTTGEAPSTTPRRARGGALTGRTARTPSSRPSTMTAPPPSRINLSCACCSPTKRGRHSFWLRDFLAAAVTEFAIPRAPAHGCKGLRTAGTTQRTARRLVCSSRRRRPATRIRRPPSGRCTRGVYSLSSFLWTPTT